MNLNETEQDPPKFVEGRDYYFDGGLMVMTEYYLLKRGYCCGKGCRHCPYEEKPAQAADSE